MKLFKCAFLVCLACSACSGGSGTSEEAAGIPDANLSLTVSNSRSFNPNISHGQIDHYRVSIFADDMEDPLVHDFDGVTQKARMLNVPIGTNRIITVEAFNPNGVVIRRGKKEGITIAANQLSQVDLVMNSVPIFTNLRDKGAVAGTRLDIHLFGEPGSKLTIAELQDNNNTRSLMKDETSGTAYVDTTNSEGFFSLNPKDFNLGVHAFEVRDENSGESSLVTVSLYKRMRPGIAIGVSGTVRQVGGQTVMSGVGSPYYREVDPQKKNLGNVTNLDLINAAY